METPNFEVGPTAENLEWRIREFQTIIEEQTAFAKIKEPEKAGYRVKTHRSPSDMDSENR